LFEKTNKYAIIENNAQKKRENARETSMINEERVKELYHMAVYDTRREKACKPAEKYYLWDYIGKECIKSVFSGTLAFFLLVLFVALGNLTQLTTFLNSVDLLQMAVRILCLYGVFMVLYLLATVLIYFLRYAHRRRELRGYMSHLRKVRRMDRDENK
jgi:hypothetical protein